MLSQRRYKKMSTNHARDGKTDMYIPTMAFVTYILLTTLLAGLSGAFEPALLGLTFSNAAVIIGLELLVLWLGRYFLSISSESQIYDLVAYSGYKFVGVIATVATSAVVGAWRRMASGSKNPAAGAGSGAGWIGWVVFGYTFLANAFFLVSFPSSPSPSPSLETSTPTPLIVPLTL